MSVFKEWVRYQSGVGMSGVPLGMEESGLMEDAKDESAWERNRNRENLEVD